MLEGSQSERVFPVRGIELILAPGKDSQAVLATTGTVSGSSFPASRFVSPSLLDDLTDDV